MAIRVHLEEVLRKGHDLKRTMRACGNHRSKPFDTSKRQGKGRSFQHHKQDLLLSWLRCGDILKFDGNLEDKDDE